jgi:hypothetical protein
MVGATPLINPVVELIVTLLPSGVPPLKSGAYGTVMYGGFDAVVGEGFC